MGNYEEKVNHTLQKVLNTAMIQVYEKLTKRLLGRINHRSVDFSWKCYISHDSQQRDFKRIFK